MVRSTTNGILKSYRFNLNKSTLTLDHARNTVLTGRQFNTYAEDPSAASRSFKLRSTLSQTDTQKSIGDSLVRKYEIAWSTVNSVTEKVNQAKEAILRGANDPTANGRRALGQELCEMAKTMAQAMNAKYGDNFVFAGADGKNPPFTFQKDQNGNDILSYRGVDVNSTDPDQQALLEYMSGESKFVDIGLGLKEDAPNELNKTSAFDCSIQGINYLGYGVDKQGNPNNIICIINEIGNVLKDCEDDGSLSPEAQEKYDQLFAKFDGAAQHLTNKYTELDTTASFLKSNQKQLETNCYIMQEQLNAMEKVDPADAITAYSWAQYSYNAALKVGNSILSESLMDYMRT